MIGKIKGIKNGGIDINGIIEDAKAKNIVTAGDFVKYLEEYEITSDKTAEINSSNYSSRFNAIELNEHKVFIAFCNSAVGYYMYGVVCIINETDIEYGTVTQLNGYDSTYSSVVALDENRVFIGHTDGGNGVANYLYGMVCTINDLEISVEISSLKLTSELNNGSVFSLVGISNDKVLITYAGGTNHYLYGIICTVSTDIINLGTKYTLVSKGVYRNVSTVLLASNKVLITYNVNYDNYTYGCLTGIVCIINGTTISKGMSKQLSKIDFSGTVSLMSLLTPNTVLICFYESLKGYSYIMLCKINSSSISVLLPDMMITYSKPLLNSRVSNNSAIVITEDKNVYLFSVTKKLFINKEIIGNMGDVNYSTRPNLIRLSNGNIFYFGSTNPIKLIYYLFNNNSGVINLENNMEEIFGIAQNKALEGQTVKVVRPNYNESEEN